MNQKTEREIRERFEDTIYRFNFYKVKLAMQALDWFWANTPNRVPTIYEMEDKVRRLFEGALESRMKKGSTSGYHASGGFVVEINDVNIVFISFVAEEESSEYDS